MNKLIQVSLITLAVFFVGVEDGATQHSEHASQQEGGAPKPPPARKIPGLTDKDDHPNGCVDCHKNMPEQKMDARFSTLMKKWEDKAPKELVEKAKEAAPEGVSVKGRHPKVKEDLTTAKIPDVCMECHAEHPKNKKKQGPPFARLAHRIHLVGGDDNHFMTFYQGECTHCHKLDKTTGQWSLGRGTEHK